MKRILLLSRATFTFAIESVEYRFRSSSQRQQTLSLDVVKMHFGGVFCWFDVIYKSILSMNRLATIVSGVNFYPPPPNTQSRKHFITNSTHSFMQQMIVVRINTKHDIFFFFKFHSPGNIYRRIYQ